MLRVGEFKDKEGRMVKAVASEDYNYLFYKDTGEFFRWGKGFDNDPQFAPSPEIADIELMSGSCSGRCDWCYKSNGAGEEKLMSLETISAILDNLPLTICQVAYGITDVHRHPDFLDILNATRDRGIVPNLTSNGLHFDKVDLPSLVNLVGAIAISCYPHLGKDVCYDAVKQLTDLGLEQVNIHLLYHQDNLPFVYEVLADTKSDSRLEKLNATVLLGLKPKGKAEKGFTPLNQEKFTELVKYCFDNDLRIGFDSCSAAKFESALEEMELSASAKARLLEMSERCESTCFSIYINVDGRAFPCSFTESGEGVDVLSAENFYRDVWTSKSFAGFRTRLLLNERKCPVYEID